MTQVGDLLPLGAAARMMAPVLGGSGSPVHSLACLGWGLAAWGAMALHLTRLRKGAAS